MSEFVGFPTGKTRFTPLPDLVFTELLVQIKDVDELKLLLYMLYFLYRQTGYPRYMTMAELESEGVLLSALAHEQDEPTELLLKRLHAAVEKNVVRRTLLQLDISDESGQTTYLFANTEQGRRAVEEIGSGELVLERRGTVREPHIERPRPNIFELYEQNIGLLQPLLAEELREAERDYPAEWIEDAFRIAVENNARNWRYIDAILRGWASRGRSDRESAHRARRR